MSVCTSVRPSVRMERLDSHWADIQQMLHLSIFRKFVENIQVSLKSGKNKGCTLHEDRYIYLWPYPAQFCLE